jgi:hypothetical protein
LPPSLKVISSNLKHNNNNNNNKNNTNNPLWRINCRDYDKLQLLGGDERHGNVTMNE